MIKEYNVKKYCCEDISLIENYDKAVSDNKMWECHHKLEIELNKTISELQAMGLYENRPASELMFLTKSEHRALHNKYMFISDETRLKLSIAGKNRIILDSTRKKLSESKTGKNKDKIKWITPSGDIKEMTTFNAHRWHPDWKRL